MAPPYDDLMVMTTAAYTSTFVLVLVWTAWSIRKHGWCRRSLRRFSYLLFLLLLAVRIGWCAIVLTTLSSEPDVSARFALRTPFALAFDYAAFVIHFLAFSMLVCGWADSTYMMMSGRSLQPTAMRSPTIFHRIGPPFAVVNFLNAAAAALTLAPAFVWPTTLGGDPSAIGGGAGDAESSMWTGMWNGAAEAVVGFSLWMGAVSRGGFALLLAVASAAAGIDVSCKIRNIAAFDPNLQSYAHEKVLKVLLAAVTFTSCGLARSYVMLHDAVQPEQPPLSAVDYLVAGVVAPDLLPTLAALLVLRKRPLCGAAGWSEDAESGLGPSCCGLGGGELGVRDLRGAWCRCCCCCGGCCVRDDSGRYVVSGVDPTPLVPGRRGRMKA